MTRRLELRAQLRRLRARRRWRSGAVQRQPELCAFLTPTRERERALNLLNDYKILYAREYMKQKYELLKEKWDAFIFY